MALAWAGSALVWAVFLVFAIVGHNTRGTVVYALFIALSVASLIWNLWRSTRPEQPAAKQPDGRLDGRAKATMIAFIVGGATIGVGILILGLRAPGKPDVISIIFGVVTLVGVAVMLVQWVQPSRRSRGGQLDGSQGGQSL